MRAKRLSTKSFRGIGDLTLEFNETEPTVLIGINGVGKSSILDCLAMLLFILSELMYQGNAVALFGEQDIQNGKDSTDNTVTVSLTNGQEIAWSLLIDKSDPLADMLGGQSLQSRTPTSRGLDTLRTLTNDVHDRIKSGSLVNLPIVLYYPVNRIVSDTLSKPSSTSQQKLALHQQVLRERKIDFSDFFIGFKNQEDLENELRLNGDPGYRDRQLESIRNAIPALLPGFSNLRVRRSPLRMTVEKQGQELIINQLSDGEKCLLAMVGDLARRLAIANPGLADPLQGEGVVLIDEIELHLHPAWQREVIPALTRTFPNCQFIVTTHSPQVVSQVKPEGIYLLERAPQGVIARHPESSYGRDSNRILEDVMGVPERPQTIKDSLRQLFRLIEEGNLDSARQLQHQLEQQIGDDEPEFARADVLIRRKEILGR
jgi:predicted ATP-binding protein involved in virulence